MHGKQTQKLPGTDLTPAPVTGQRAVFALTAYPYPIRTKTLHFSSVAIRL